jgi:hypothetical protein
MDLRQGLAQNNHFLSFMTIRDWGKNSEHLLRLRTMYEAPHPCVLECIFGVVGVPVPAITCRVSGRDATIMANERIFSAVHYTYEPVTVPRIRFRADAVDP